MPNNYTYRFYCEKTTPKPKVVLLNENRANAAERPAVEIQKTLSTAELA